MGYKITYERGIENVTIEECLKAHSLGLAVIINEGREITFEIE
jgi:hypothetical protein